MQLVLEVLEDNVKRGSDVYEKGHILVLGWVDNRRDEEVMWKILSQVHFPNGPGTSTPNLQGLCMLTCMVTQPELLY